MSDVEEQPTRICRKCSVATNASGDFCPSCGASYARRSRRPSRKIVAVNVILLLIAGGAAGGLVAKQQSDGAARDRADAAAERQERREANLAADVQQEADETERSARADLVDALEEQVTKDAKKVDEDLLDGPILYSTCTATGGGSTDDLTALTGTFECMAVNKENADDTVSGYRYSGTAEWGTGSISWRLGG